MFRQIRTRLGHQGFPSPLESLQPPERAPGWGCLCCASGVSLACTETSCVPPSHQAAAASGWGRPSSWLLLGGGPRALVSATPASGPRTRGIGSHALGPRPTLQALLRPWGTAGGRVGGGRAGETWGQGRRWSSPFLDPATHHWGFSSCCPCPRPLCSGCLPPSFPQADFSYHFCPSLIALLLLSLPLPVALPILEGFSLHPSL